MQRFGRIKGEDARFLRFHVREASILKGRYNDIVSIQVY